MRKFSIDTNLRVRLFHQPGQLARLAAAIAEQGSLMGEIAIVSIDEHHTVRDVAIETSDDEHTRRVIGAVKALAGIELLAITDRVFERHQGGKIRSGSRVKVEQVVDLRHIYTPGVARVAKAIEREPALAWDLTSLGHSVGIFTNGSRVLGLGNIGPLASLPVMEGKAVLYDRFAGLSATPLLVDTLEAERFVDAVELLSRSFGGIHLEDIRIPECFVIERELIRRLQKPVMHDDQHGTAIVALAAVLNACKLTGVDPSSSRVGQIGLGAAGSAIARLALTLGAREVLVSDVSPQAVAALEAEGARGVDLPTLLQQADIVVATTGKPGLIRPDMVRRGQVIFSLSNPDPEIDPGAAVAAGAAFAGDGRSINNALAFPGLFKGILEARARRFTPEMYTDAARVIASFAQPGEVVPSPFDMRIHDAVREAVLLRARQQDLIGTARL
ncbi:MAG: NAD-dependent malic enzyme [Polyangiaceae bacterium]|nr:NAD-dependent malic enzyme [Polyangiaceae bacterium]